MRGWALSLQLWVVDRKLNVVADAGFMLPTGQRGIHSLRREVLSRDPLLKPFLGYRYAELEAVFYVNVVLLRVHAALHNADLKAFASTAGMGDPAADFRWSGRDDPGLGASGARDQRS